MKTNNIITLLIIALAANACCFLTGCGKDDDTYTATETTKEERQHIREGNKLYDDKEYAEAEIEYRKALQANPNSAAAYYNLALSIAHQVSSKDSTEAQEMTARADSMFSLAASMTKDKKLKAMSYHNMGNLRYETANYAPAIEAYKNSLRIDPNDDDTRYNLRMAQLKLQQQQQQQQNNKDNKDNNQNQDQQKNQDNKDKQDNQDKQDQDKQNQDKQNQDKQDKQDNQDKKDQKQENAQSQPANMDERNIQQVLKAAQEDEKNVNQRVNQMLKRQKQKERRETQNKW